MWYVACVLAGIAIGWVAFERPELARNAWDTLKSKVKRDGG